ncbi:nonribosomal peptide synthetase 1 [Aspergillus affinis]|uniref:nonribosomal peptide synthetase 1 n=1 Tax=Aspergillus affinis TaxID=1070780 RepID=UPI0022FE6391|nr:nonribosomal peptide synthetase 1 [Aspergillus affinis]KAI9045028.1 nonribosomal peptide synthetase 1 [Aspergillus affinis]
MTDDSQIPRCWMPCLVPRTGDFESKMHDGAGRRTCTVPIERSWGAEITPIGFLRSVQAAWAILLRSYTASDDVCFRVMKGERPAASTQPVVYRASLTGSTPVLSLLELDAVTVQHLSNGSTDRLPYNTAIYYNDDSGLSECLKDINIAVRVQYNRTERVESMELGYKTDTLSHEQAKIIAKTLVHLLSEIQSHSNATIQDIRVCSAADLDRMRRWNKEFTGDFSTAERSVHEVILQKCHERPSAVAVSAWDGDITYDELDGLSAALETQLREADVKPEEFVPLYFEKSKWVPVAVLGILRAGAAFVLLETSHPVDWLQKICESISATVVLCAPDSLSMAKQLAPTAIPLSLDPSKVDSQRSRSDGLCHASSPLYAVFTSGSTGRPKGIVMEHGPFCTSTKRTVGALEIGPNTRRLQFASHAFTMCNREVLTTLMVGGCLCIPSAHQRIYDLVGFINRHNVNYSYMTPSTAVILSPEAAPGIRVLLLGGEAMQPSLLAKWAGKVKLLYGYGASETAGVAILASDIGSDWDPHNLGFARDSALWVTEVNNPNRLAPIGGVGELLIQGEGLARHYIDDEERNRRVFLQGVEWSNGFSEFRLYRTGDLVRYNVDGSIRYIGRKDSQIKINGQLADMNHVEHVVQRCMEGLSLEFQHVAAIAVPAAGGGSAKRRSLQLMAILGHGPQLKQDDQDTTITNLENGFPGLSTSLEKVLANYLPRYMIPTHFAFCKNMPMTKSGKMNRPKLTELAVQVLAEATTEHKDRYSDSREERALKDAWNETLGMLPLLGDDFFRKSGDSIKAIQLSARLHEDGFVLTVVDIFRERTFAAMATALRAISSTGMPEPAPPPFSLYTADASVLRAISEELAVGMSLIEDLYPCTPMQEALVASSVRNQGASIARHAWTLPKTVNLDMFKKSWSTVWMSNPVLRSRIGRVGSRMLQVVTRTEMPWRVVKSLDDPEPVSSERGPLIRFAVTLEKPSRFQLVIHHAVFDAWSLSLVCKQVQHAYQGTQVALHSFNRFIPYLRQNAGLASALYWQEELGGFKGCHFPESPAGATVQEKSMMTVAHSFETELAGELGFTAGTYLRLAWAIVLSQETGCPDVVFGAIVTGRSAAMAGISSLSGPTLALVPVRVQLSPTVSVDSTLQQVEEQSFRMIAYEQTGLQHIAKAGDDVEAASKFQNVMVIQPRQRMESMRSGLFAHPVDRKADYLLPFTSHPFMLVCHIGEGSVSLEASFNSCVVSSDNVRRLLRQLAHTVKELIRRPQSTIGEISLLPVEDREQIKQWNNHVSSSSQTSVVDLIRRRCQTQPDSVALCGADCSLTYQDLDRFSANFAAWLKARGACRGQYVPLMFKKSPWASVAMTAVLRTGAAFVMLPPSYPLGRLRSIVSETEAQFIAASPACAEASRQLSGNVIVLDGKASEHPPEGQQYSSAAADSAFRSNDPAYLVFTSGSTGKPKGIVLHHGAVTTGIAERCQGLRLDSSSRVFQFASYAFDVSINDTIMALVTGSCLCVPTESELQDNPSQAAFQLRANWAMVTPSIIRLLDPTVASTLRTFVVGGEPLTLDVVKKWEHHVRIIQIYGPAECTVLSTIQADVTSDSEMRNIGKAVHSASWIVDPHDHDRLRPIGMTGELLLQGPTVGLGYLKNPKQSAASFGSSPQWLQEMSAPSSSHAIYKTGDLVKYGEDGSLFFVGRKDLQIKFRGQRLEPAEVESNIMSLIPAIKEIMVEMIQFKTQSSREALVAFICPGSSMNWGFSEDPNGNLDLLTPGGSFYNDIATLSSQLGERLSSYMVPTIFIPLRKMPLTLTIKVNHTLLREEIATWLPEKISAYRPHKASQAAGRGPKSAREECIYKLACSILSRDDQNVSMDYDFFSLGGDSITATLFALAAKREGIRISVNDIFQHKTLAQLAQSTVIERPQCKELSHDQSLAMTQQIRKLIAKVLKLNESQVTNSSDFIDLGGDSITCLELVVQARREGILITEQSVFETPRISSLVRVAKVKAGEKFNEPSQRLVSVSDETLRKELPADVFAHVVEVLPTTQFQRMSNIAMNYRYYRIALPVRFDKSRLLSACQQLVHRHAILRTGFFKLSSGDEVQLVLQPRKVAVHEHHAKDLDEHCWQDNKVADSQNCGKPPFQVQLVTVPHGRVFLVFRLSHALFDRLSIRLISEDISSIYSRQPLLQTNPLSVHLRAALALRNDAAFNTWRRVLAGSEVTRLARERLPVMEEATLCKEPAYLVKIEKQITPVVPPSGFTLSTLLKAAWATTLAEIFRPHGTSLAGSGQSSNPPVVFGQVVHGRGVGVPHEDRILGPCISIIPVRVDVDHTAPRIDLLRQIQQQMVDTMPYSTLGFDDIRDNCTTWPKSTRLPSFLRVRNYQFTPPCWFEGVPCEAIHYGIPNKPSPSANVHVVPSSTELHVDITISSHMLGPKQVKYIVHHFCKTIQSFDAGIRSV